MSGPVRIVHPPVLFTIGGGEDGVHVHMRRVIHIDRWRWNKCQRSDTDFKFFVLAYGARGHNTDTVNKRGVNLLR